MKKALPDTKCFGLLVKRAGNLVEATGRSFFIWNAQSKMSGAIPKGIDRTLKNVLGKLLAQTPPLRKMDKRNRCIRMERFEQSDFYFVV